MWVIVISLCLPILVTSTEEICKESPFDVCPSPLELKQIENADDVKAVCPKVKDNVICLGNYTKKCGDDAPLMVLSMEGEYESLLQLVIDMCDETSLLHAVLMENLKCLKDAVLIGSNDACYNDEKKATEAYSSYLNSEDSEVEETTRYALESCLFHLYTPTCYVEDVEKNCGSLAKDITIEILHRSYYLQTFCYRHSAAEFAKDIGRVKMTDSQKEILKDLIGKILEN